MYTKKIYLASDSTGTVSNGLSTISHAQTLKMLQLASNRTQRFSFLKVDNASIKAKTASIQSNYSGSSLIYVYFGLPHDSDVKFKQQAGRSERQ